VLLQEPGGYLIEHIKGISREVSEDEFPEEYRDAMIEARAEIETEHIEEDLESERVAALYVMTHYLRGQGDWWKPVGAQGSPLIEEIVKKHWDQGPFERIRVGVKKRAAQGQLSLIELGCGVGGLLRVLSSSLDQYLGVDSSFASIVLARRLALGAQHGAQGPHANGGSALCVPGDLLDGTVSRDVSGLAEKISPADNIAADFIVAYATTAAFQPGEWDVCASLNMIDMLESPEDLPALQKELVRKGGWTVQSSPYIWHPAVAEGIRERLASSLPLDSARAVKLIYEQAGLTIESSEEHVPWLFFKNYRQIELYSVHVLFASRA
jgi:SAM-dependent methyltransferase